MNSSNDFVTKMLSPAKKYEDMKRYNVEDIPEEEFSNIGKAIAESIMAIANEPVRPGSLRSILGEDKSNKVYNFPVSLKFTHNLKEKP